MSPKNWQTFSQNGVILTTTFKQHSAKNNATAREPQNFNYAYNFNYYSENRKLTPRFIEHKKFDKRKDKLGRQILVKK
ncbi:MAG: hypothetical protein CML56_01900 [Rhodobacteraceae bacterium]|nr:hypothetical protein [Paracoccaceae bacterium]